MYIHLLSSRSGSGADCADIVIMGLCGVSLRAVVLLFIEVNSFGEEYSWGFRDDPESRCASPHVCTLKFSTDGIVAA